MSGGKARTECQGVTSKKENHMTSIPLPPVCLTCLPPWPQAMMYAGKNLENRCESVARRLAPFVGQTIGISQSKGAHPANRITEDCHEALVYLANSELAPHWVGQTPRRLGIEDGRGKLLLVAKLDRIAAPSEFGSNAWHVEGQHGLVFGNVWQVEPVACTGGTGAWRPNWCDQCGHIVADNARTPEQCPTCKADWHKHGVHHATIDRPKLRIVRECQC
jgi:hypothetical protein